MKIILKNAKIIDVSSPFHNQIVDVKITNEIIDSISPTISKHEDYTEIEIPNLCLSKGWFDSSVSFGEPGFEDRETIAHGLEVAAKSGFTAVALQPNTFPIIDNQSQIQFVQQKAMHSGVDLFPIGALTKNSEGDVVALRTPGGIEELEILAVEYKALDTHLAPSHLQLSENPGADAPAA